MKQYCRYCANLVTGNGIWCSEKETELAEATTKRPNVCKDFVFCPIDAYGLTEGYKPRRREPVADEIGQDQCSLEGFE